MRERERWLHIIEHQACECQFYKGALTLVSGGEEGEGAVGGLRLHAIIN